MAKSQIEDLFDDPEEEDFDGVIEVEELDDPEEEVRSNLKVELGYNPFTSRNDDWS